MYLFSKALICVLLVISTLEPIKARKGFSGRASYPKSGGLSGGHHSSGSHGYPASGGLSGGGHGYPSGGSHARPPSGGSHAYPASGGNHGYPNSGSHGYPSSGSMSGNSRPTGSHGYPSSSGGLSGNTPSRYPSNTHSSGSTTNVHYHYHYSPPKQISYTPRTGGPPQHFPVYQGTPPTYVYQYKDSGSKYGTLLAGLALLNLGTLAGAAYAGSHSRHSNYKPQPGEVCKFAVRRDNGDYEETKIDCQLITSFIFQEEAKPKPNAMNTTITTTTVTNVTTINTTNPGAPVPEPAAPPALPIYQMLPNGTLVPVNATVAGVNNTSPVTNATSAATNNSVTSSVIETKTVTNTTVVNALDVKGKPVEVTPGLKCYVIRTTPVNNMRKAVDCGLLQTYANKSLRRNSASQNMPMLTVLAVAVFVCQTIF